MLAKLEVSFRQNNSASLNSLIRSFTFLRVEVQAGGTMTMSCGMPPEIGRRICSAGNPNKAKAGQIPQY
jgi:hypothetical protein